MDLLAAAGLSKASVDRLGEAMRRRDLTPADIATFNRYRAAFEPALASAVQALRVAGEADVTERQKSLRSTIAKLRRETARLSQLQDIAGCRIVLSSVREADSVLHTLAMQHNQWRIFDRRADPSHGYRAVHVIASFGGLQVEIQVRTLLQHAWAELSEAWDRVYEGVKYGRGPDQILRLLSELSQAIALVEEGHAGLAEAEASVGAVSHERWLKIYRDAVSGGTAHSRFETMVAQAGDAPGGPERLLALFAERNAMAHTALLQVINESFPETTT